MALSTKRVWYYTRVYPYLPVYLLSSDIIPHMCRKGAGYLRRLHWFQNRMDIEAIKLDCSCVQYIFHMTSVRTTMFWMRLKPRTYISVIYSKHVNKQDYSKRDPPFTISSSNNLSIISCNIEDYFHQITQEGLLLINMLETDTSSLADILLGLCHCSYLIDQIIP